MILNYLTILRTMIKTYYQHLKSQYIISIDPDGSKLVLALKCTVIGIFAFIINYYLEIPQGIFLFLSAILFMIVAPTDLPRKSLVSMAICAGLSAVGCFLVTIASKSVWQLSLSLFFVAFLLIYVNKYKKISNFVGIIALMIVVVAAGLGGDFTAALARAVNNIIGLIIAIIFTFFIFPYHTFKKSKLRLSIVFDKLSDYFYHTIADSLRGNHLILRHHQKKHELLSFALNNRLAITALALKHKKYASLQEIAMQQESLMQVIFALANLFNQPIYYSAVVYFFPNLKEFYLTANQLYRCFAAYVCGEVKVIPELKQFESSIDELNQKLQESMLAVMSDQAIYQWPFDSSNFSYLLSLLKVKTQNLNKALQSL